MYFLSCPPPKYSDIQYIIRILLTAKMHISPVYMVLSGSNALFCAIVLIESGKHTGKLYIRLIDDSMHWVYNSFIIPRNIGVLKFYKEKLRV